MNGDPEGWVEFDHLDGMYSYCVAYSASGVEIGVVHLAANMPLEKFGDGWKVSESKDAHP